MESAPECMDSKVISDQKSWANEKRRGDALVSVSGDETRLLLARIPSASVGEPMLLAAASL